MIALLALLVRGCIFLVVSENTFYNHKTRKIFKNFHEPYFYMKLAIECTKLQDFHRFITYL